MNPTSSHHLTNEGGVCNSWTALNIGAFPTELCPFDRAPLWTGLPARLTNVFWLSTLVPAENWLDNDVVVSIEGAVDDVPGAPLSRSSALGGGTRERLANGGEDDVGTEPACCCALDLELDLALLETGVLATGVVGADLGAVAVAMADERSSATSLTATREGGGCDLRLLERLVPLLPPVCIEILATMGWTRDGSTFH
jgi:hypothetical protein